MEEIRGHRIQIYELPPTDNDEDEDFKKKDRELKVTVKFRPVVHISLRHIISYYQENLYSS